MTELKAVIELRPRLQICNVFLQLSNIFEKQQGSLQLTVEPCKIILNIFSKEQIFGIDTVKLKPQTVSGLKFENRNLSFRIQIEPFSDVSNSAAEMTVYFPKYKPDVQVEEIVNIACKCCGNYLTETVQFKRILPLPSDGWNFDDVFCHNHDTHDNLPDKITNPGCMDCLYGNYYFVINNKLLKNQSEASVTYCQRCFSWIGINEKSSTKLWNCTVEFISADRQVMNVIPLNDFISVIKLIVKEAAGPVCKLIVTTKVSDTNTHYLLLWVIDKNLSILTNSNRMEDTVLSRISVTKLLYAYHKEFTCIVKTWENDINVYSISVAKQMMVDGLKCLTQSTRFFPESCQSASNMYVAYLQI